MIRVLLMNAILWGAANALASESVCNLKLSISDVSLTWRSGLGTQTIPFSVTKKKSLPCFAVITFSSGGASDYACRQMVNGTHTLHYQLYKEPDLTNVLKAWPHILNPNDYISAHIGVGKDLTQQFYYYISLPPPASNVIKPGLYIDTFTVKAYSNFDFLDPDDVRTVTLQTFVLPVVDISLVPTGAPFSENDTSESVNFGALTRGTMKSFDLRVRSNAGYSLSFSSQNGGVLRHSNKIVTTAVSYTLRVNGQTRTLSANSPTVVATGVGETIADGAVLPVSFTIGDTNDKVAGSYFDNITVTATSNE